MATEHAPQQTSGTTAKGLRWIAFVVALILLNVSICTITVIASRRSQPPVEAAYDIKALKWDDSAAQRAANQSLGWKSRVRIEAVSGTPRLVVELFDSSWRPIRTAQVSASVSSSDSAQAQTTLALESNDEGGYAAFLPNQTPGWWRIDLAADAGGMRFTDSTRALLTELPQTASTTRSAR